MNSSRSPRELIALTQQLDLTSSSFSLGPLKKASLSGLLLRSLVLHFLLLPASVRGRRGLRDSRPLMSQFENTSDLAPFLQNSLNDWRLLFADHRRRKHYFPHAGRVAGVPGVLLALVAVLHHVLDLRRRCLSVTS